MKTILALVANDAAQCVPASVLPGLAVSMTGIACWLTDMGLWDRVTPASFAWGTLHMLALYIVLFAPLTFLAYEVMRAVAWIADRMER